MGEGLSPALSLVDPFLGVICNLGKVPLYHDLYNNYYHLVFKVKLKQNLISNLKVKNIKLFK